LGAQLFFAFFASLRWLLSDVHRRPSAFIGGSKWWVTVSPGLPVVETRDLVKSYRRGDQIVPVLAGITFDIAQGDFVALMGPSGSGKSTLLNLIAGIDKPDSGALRVGGVDITQLGEAELADWRARNVGFVFQFYNLMPVLTAFENVELPLLLTRLSAREREAHVETALAMVALGDRMEHCTGDRDRSDDTGG
jgi:putative ABC transport system ATP-binding protein